MQIERRLTCMKICTLIFADSLAPEVALRYNATGFA